MCLQRAHRLWTIYAIIGGRAGVGGVSWSQRQLLGATGSSTAWEKVTVPEHSFLERSRAAGVGARCLERGLRTPVPGTQVLRLLSRRALPLGVRGSSQHAVGL